MQLRALASVVLALGLASPSLEQNARWNELADLPFQKDYPTDETAQRFIDELLLSLISAAFSNDLSDPGDAKGVNTDVVLIHINCNRRDLKKDTSRILQWGAA